MAAQQLYDPKTDSWYTYDPGNAPPSESSSWQGGALTGLPTASGSGSSDIMGVKYSDPSLSKVAGGPAPAGGSMLISPTGSAKEMAAQVLQNEFANWEQQFKPVEMNLLQQSSIENPNVLTDAVNNAKTGATNAYASMEGVQNRQMAAEGIKATPQQQAVSTRLRNLSAGASVTGAENRARQNVATQDQIIAYGVSPNPNVAAQAANAKYASQ